MAQSGLVCPICLSLFANPHSLRGCGHEFCLRCIRRVCEVSTSCPVCRNSHAPEHDGRAPTLAELVTPNRCVPPAALPHALNVCWAKRASCEQNTEGTSLQ